MNSRATTILAAAAAVQAALLLAALGILVLRLRDVRAELTAQETGERDLLNELADVERSMYNTSLLLRDYILVSRPERESISQELTAVLQQLATRPIRQQSALPPGLGRAVEAADVARREFLERATALAALEETDRYLLGARYLSGQLAPLRQKFSDAARYMDALVRSLRESRNRAMADSLRGIQTLILRMLSGAGVLGLLLAAAGVWRFRRFELEREIHLHHLEAAEEGLRGLSQKLVESQETERKRISRELHDEVGQNLTALRVQLGQILPADPASAANLTRSAELADRSLRTVREMARGLRPAMLDDLGLGPALQWLGRDFSNSTALDVTVTIDGDLATLSEAQRTCLYRVAQEALTNCAKHAGSSAAQVVLWQDSGRVILTIEDQGKGFTSGPEEGIGLLGMRERVEELAGDLTVTTAPLAGTLIRAVLPAASKESHDSGVTRR